MSKRKSLGQANTLFNYFQSPKADRSTKPKETPEKTNDAKENVQAPVKEQSKALDDNVTPSKKPKIKEKQPVQSEDESDEEIPAITKKRSRIIVAESSDSENEAQDTKTSKKIKIDKKPTCLQQFSFEQKSEEDITEQSELGPPPMAPKAKAIPVEDVHGTWKHNTLKFLKPEFIKDAEKRRPDNPLYDSRTLFVPDDFLNSQTPAMRQWWILKSKHYDTVLFFKVGKFYELYHMDATVGVQHLGFSYMRGEFAHSGFPETAYGKMASTLIEKGFKLARIEQTETPEMMAERCKRQGKTTKYDKVVKREICQITTKATCIYGAQLLDAPQAFPCYMYAICEKKSDNRFGVCFVDTSIGTFHLADFVDDRHCSKLLALFSEHPPGLVLYERGQLSANVSTLLKTQFSDIRKDSLAPNTQFYSASSTLERLAVAPYFLDKKEQFSWPEFFSTIADECLPKKEYELAIRSLGACMWYLKDSELDIQVFSMRKFMLYEPLEIVSKSQKIDRDYMVLDASTMRNLNLLGDAGSLQKTLDYCETAFGKRLLQQWICRPSCDLNTIKSRQEVVKELVNNPDLLKTAQLVLKSLPDLERQIAKIHTFGNKVCAKEHPDSRAIFYEAATYSTRKINDLLKTLKGFEASQSIAKIFAGCESRLLLKLTQFPPKGKFVDLSSTLKYFRESFDQEEAATKGKIIPKKGIDEDYDHAEEAIAEIHNELNEYLEEMQKFFRCKLSYFGHDKKRFQLEVPESQVKKVPSDFVVESSRKGKNPVKRYYTPRTRELLAAMIKAEGNRAKIIQDLNRRIFEKFSQRYEEWEQATQCLTFLDVLCSLAKYAFTYNHDKCLPVIKPFQKDNSLISMDEARHPCVPNIDNFVPNDVRMNVGRKAGLLILTGPNMGGKSTLMRKVALVSVMAQIGSYVPAASCELNLIDRIFTRLGAQDDIIGGQSTFFVELSEASAILQHATSSSLVLLDELGRGTSTHDGNAIATAYVRKLTELKCRTLFATHYHSLVDHFKDREDVQQGHMACMVENDADPTEESVTFLYKMVEGRCPNSYGFNAARLAGLKHSIITKSREVANKLEKTNKNRDVFRKLFSGSISDLRACFAEILNI